MWVHLLFKGYEMEVKFIRVEVIKDITSVIVTDVPEHELVLLQLASGSDMDEEGGGDYIGSVRKIEDLAVTYQIENVQAEYDRLKEKFRVNASGKFLVQEAYNTVTKFKEELQKIAIKPKAK